MPDDPAALPAYLRRFTTQLIAALNAPQKFLEYEIQHAEPSKIRAGMIVYADGTDWDPGSGAGGYRRNEANNAWVFVG